MIAVDIMGGDFAPDAPLGGAFRAAKKGIPVLLCGPKDKIISQLDDLDQNWESYPIEILDAQEVIAMDADPVKSALKKVNSSLVLAVKSVKIGKALGVVSAGNSGALLASASFVLGLDEGVERPAIAGFLPGRKRSVLCLDLGANTECKPSYLLQFAHMGAQHLTKMFGISKPRIGLLSNGSEESKGSLLVKSTFPLLKKSALNFVGNIEPGDITDNKIDVVVCDGFSGNILLKTMESTSRMILDVFGNGGKESFIKRTDWEAIGGALLLGVKGTVIVSHGCSNEIAIENAIQSALLASRGESYLPALSGKKSNVNSV